MAAMNIIDMFARGKFPEGIARYYTPDAGPYKSVWRRTVEAADAANDPGDFTAFIGYE